jgi:hypothetical protein
VVANPNLSEEEKERKFASLDGQSRNFEIFFDEASAVFTFLIEQQLNVLAFFPFLCSRTLLIAICSHTG